MVDSAILLSVHPKHATKILCGEKTVELRRKRPRFLPGTLALIYSSSPVCSVLGVIEIGKIIEGSPAALWNKAGRRACVTREAYDRYFCGSELATALVIKRALLIPEPVTLKALRWSVPGFQPPQTYIYLNNTTPIGRLLKRILGDLLVVSRAA